MKKLVLVALGAMVVSSVAFGADMAMEKKDDMVMKKGDSMKKDDMSMKEMKDDTKKGM